MAAWLDSDNEQVAIVGNSITNGLFGQGAFHLSVAVAMGKTGSALHPLNGTPAAGYPRR